MVRMSLWILLLFLTPPESSQDPKEVLRARLEHELRTIADRVDGVVGVTIQDLTTAERFVLHGDTVFTQASAIKLPVLVELFRQVEQGHYRLDELVTLAKDDIVPGSGILQRLTPGSVTMPLRDVATLMVTVSDNTAWMGRINNVQEQVSRADFFKGTFKRVH